jgi:hypothetical protein
MATNTLPAVLVPTRAAPQAPALAPARKASLLHYVYDAIVEAQTRRAERAITYHLRALGLRHPHDR